MKIRSIRILAVTLLAASLTITGCNRNGNAGAEVPKEDAAGENAGDSVITISGTADNDRGINFVRNPYDDTSVAQADGTTDVDITTTPAYSGPDFEAAGPDESAPQFFDVEDPIEPIMGYCDNSMCDALIRELNSQRTLFGVSTVEKNSSLCVAADVRAREYAIYPVYKERPDGRDFTSVSPQGYVRNEYFCVPARNSITPVWDAQKGMWTGNNPPYKEYTYTPATVMEGLMEIREARNILLNDDYKQVGASWFVTGGYFIAGFTLSY